MFGSMNSLYYIYTIKINIDGIKIDNDLIKTNYIGGIKNETCNYL